VQQSTRDAKGPGDFRGTRDESEVAEALMSSTYVSVRSSMTAGDVLEFLRRTSPQGGDVYYLYVLDESGRLEGTLGLRALVVADAGSLVRDIMSRDVIRVHTGTDQEKVGRLMTSRHLQALPVVDGEGRLVGTVTLDAVMNVAEEEATEDIHKLGGLEALDVPYDRTTFWPMVRKRGGWLSALFVGETLTATAMGRYEAEIARAVVLALFVPLVISSGGNSGSQAASLVIRALALNELRLRDWLRVLRREVTSGLALGAALGAIGFARIVTWHGLGLSDYGDHAVSLAATIAISLVGVVCFGTLAGSMLPFVLLRLGFDPATSSTPFIATLVDVTGLIIYFQVASVVLRGSLL
jgi:magnesium transporter